MVPALPALPPLPPLELDVLGLPVEGAPAAPAVAPPSPAEPAELVPPLPSIWAVVTGPSLHAAAIGRPKTHHGSQRTFVVIRSLVKNPRIECMPTRRTSVFEATTILRGSAQRAPQAALISIVADDRDHRGATQPLAPAE